MLTAVWQAGGFLRRQWDVLVLGAVIAAILATLAYLMMPRPVVELVLETPPAPVAAEMITESVQAVHMTEPLAASAARTAYPVPQKKMPPKPGSININTASAEQLQQLPGVGPVLARRIIEHRQVSGAFASIEAIDAVSGIGPKKFADMKAYLRI